MSLVLDVDTARWIIQGAASILIASRSPQLRPSLGLGLGCRIGADRGVVTVFLLAERNRTLVADLRESRAISVVFTNAITHRAVQLKAADARFTPLEPGDIERMHAHTGALVRDWTQRGLPEAFTRALHARDAGDSVLAVQFSPYLAFDQTPGPHAGMPLVAGAG